MSLVPPTPLLPAVSIVGPAPRFRIDRRSLQIGSRNDEIAVYQDGHWHSDGRTFTVLESEVPTLLVFEEDGDAPREARGPFASVQVTEGAIRVGIVEKQVLAVFDEDAEVWRLAPDWQGYVAVVLSPAVPSDEDEETDAEFTADDFIQSDHTQSRPSIPREEGRWAIRRLLPW